MFRLFLARFLSWLEQYLTSYKPAKELLYTSSVPKKADCHRYLFAQKWPNLGFIGIVQLL